MSKIVTQNFIVEYIFLAHYEVKNKVGCKITSAV